MLPSIGNEIIKAVVAQYNAEQLLTQRDKVSKAVRNPQAVERKSSFHQRLCRGISKVSAQVRESLTLRAKEFNILVDDVAITHLSFGTEVTNSSVCSSTSHDRACPCCASQQGLNSLCTITCTWRCGGSPLGLCLQFTKAVESKQVAQQDAERARFVVMKADQVSVVWQLIVA